MYKERNRCGVGSLIESGPFKIPINLCAGGGGGGGGEGRFHVVYY